MKYLYLCLLLFSFGEVLAGASVHRSLDEEGNPVFSDTPTADSEPVELKEVQTVPAESDLKFEYTPPVKEAEKYTSLSITTPADDSAVRENAGNLEVSIASKPKLAPGHRALLYLDGSEVAQGAQTSFSLENLDRGTHTLSVAIMAGDEVLIESKPISFTLLRHSEQHPKPAPPPPPPKP